MPGPKVALGPYLATPPDNHRRQNYRWQYPSQPWWRQGYTYDENRRDQRDSAPQHAGQMTGNSLFTYRLSLPVQPGVAETQNDRDEAKDRHGYVLAVPLH